ncbi:MAG: M23 family metallopeptidase [Cyanobacteria bacterium P01_F01_bin.150]
MSLRDSEWNTVDVSDSSYDSDEARIELADPFVRREYEEYQRERQREINRETAETVGRVARDVADKGVDASQNAWERFTTEHDDVVAAFDDVWKMLKGTFIIILLHMLLTPLRPALNQPRMLLSLLAQLFRFNRYEMQSVSYQSGSMKPLVRGDVVAGYAIGGEFGEDRGTHKHQGVDWKVPVNTPLIAPFDVEVVQQFDKGGYGLFCLVRPLDQTGKFPGFLLGHMNSCNQGVHPPGAEIALTGGQKGDRRAGRSTGPHLHFEQIEQGTRVHPQYGWLLALATGQLPLSGGDHHMTALVNAFIGKESSGDCSAKNKHTAAIGATQIMGANITGARGWDITYLGRDITISELMGDCALQRELSTAVLSDYWNQTSGSHEERIRQVGAMWYGGPDDRMSYNDTKPQCVSDGTCYDSFFEYTTHLLKLYHAEVGQI